MLSQPYPATNLKALRVVFLGVGNELQGDDAAGLLVIRALAARLSSSPTVLILEGGVAPENFTGKIRKFTPDRVIIVDAADMGFEPGTIQVIPLDQVDGFSASSHILPLSVLAKFIIADTGCEVGIVGIQAKSLEMGEDVSAPVQRAVATLVDVLYDQLTL